MAEEVVVTIKVQGQRELERSLSNAEKSFESWAKKIQSQTSILSQGMGTALGNAITGALNLGLRAFENFGKSAVDVLKNSIKSAANMQDISIAFEVMIGDAERAKKLLVELSDFAKRTPFSLGDLQEQSKRLLAFGFSADEIIPTMETLGNIAAGVGREELPFLVKALGDVKARTYLTAQEVNQFVNANVGLKQLLADLYKTSIPEVNRLIEEQAVSYEDVVAALGLATEKGGKFHDLMDRQSTTFNGMISNLEDFRDQALRSFGGINEAGELIDGGFLDILSGKLQTALTWLNENETAINNLAVTIGTELAGKFEDAFNWFFENKEEIYTAITDVTGALSDMVGTVGDAIGLVEDLGTGLSDTFGLGITYTGMNALELNKFQKEIEASGYRIEDLGADYKNQFGQIIGSTKNAEDAMMIFRNRVDGAKKSTDNLGYGGSGAMETLAGNTSNATGQMYGLRDAANSAAYALANAAANAAFAATAGARGRFASGGIVPNAANGFTVGSGTGDRSQVNVNGGEMIINTQQQNALFAFIKRLANGGGGVTNNIGSVSFGGDRPKGQEMNMFNQLLMNI